MGSYFFLHFPCIILTIFSVVSPSLGESASYTACSTPYSCGKIQNVGYPFWGEDRPKYCGISDLKLSCDDNKITSINVYENSDFALSVHGINISSDTMVLSLKALLERCVLQTKSLVMLPTLQPVGVAFIKLFYGCNATCASKYDSKSFTCTTYGDGSNGTGYYFGKSAIEAGRPIEDDCPCKNNFYIPMDNKGQDELRSRNASLQSILKRQLIEMRYNVNYSADCTKCRGSGGSCGSSKDSSSDRFVCYCPNGNHPLVCPPNSGKPRKTRLVLATIFAPISIIILLAFGAWIYMRKKKATKNSSLPFEEIKMMESLHFDLSTIRVATRNFCVDNKLGGGGFGAVYKGILDDGQEIALKRLGKQSKQGIVEFKTEVLLLAKLQHKNLVKLLGFCATSDEKILIYEYLQNLSLDRFLFGPSSKLILDWATRYKIILGIARGLLYLHEDSRLKIIHRDLKTSNILLDKVLNPKISDFGLARLFGGDETQGDTKRVVGTFGYMAPEYAMTGRFSVKSDVYSFGVIVLEIVTGQKNIIFGQAQVVEALLHRAWRLWNEGAPLDMVDATLGNNYPVEEVQKCIHIGLLCIQDMALERPRMASVVAALNGQSISLPLPKAPHFFSDPTIANVSPVLYNQIMEGNAVEYHQHQALDQEGRPFQFSGTENITQLYPR